MLESELMDKLDKSAYFAPGLIPEEIQRRDKFQYRVYFRFMCALYELYKNGVYTKDELAVLKTEFLRDWEVFGVLAKANIKTCRQVNQLEIALTECRKKDGCSCCKNVSGIWGAVTLPCSEDINIPDEAYADCTKKM